MHNPLTAAKGRAGAPWCRGSGCPFPPSPLPSPCSPAGLWHRDVHRLPALAHRAAAVQRRTRAPRDLCAALPLARWLGCHLCLLEKEFGMFLWILCFAVFGSVFSVCHLLPWDTYANGAL